MDEEARHKDHERRLTANEQEVSSIKENVATLTTGQEALQRSQDRGFEDIRGWITDLQSSIQAGNNAPPKIGVGMLITLLTFFGFIIVSGIGAFWAAVLLLFQPMKEDLQEHKDDISHEGMNARVSLVEERSKSAHDLSAKRDSEQQKEIDGMRGAVHELENQRVADAELRGRLLAYHEWIRDDAEAIKMDLAKHSEESGHDVLLTDVAELRGLIRGLLLEREAEKPEEPPRE